MPFGKAILVKPFLVCEIEGDPPRWNLMLERICSSVSSGGLRFGIFVTQTLLQCNVARGDTSLGKLEGLWRDGRE